MEDNVGTRPESVVKRRGRLERGSWEDMGCGMRATGLRGGDTKELPGASFRGECCERYRISSMLGRRIGYRWVNNTRTRRQAKR
jgi:hypothetical protein